MLNNFLNMIKKINNKIKQLVNLIFKLLYSQKQDILFNENFLNSKNFNILKIKEVLKKNNINYNDQDLSWHYHIYGALSLKKDNIKILEIGTFDGAFTNFLSKNFKNSKIFTCDLPTNDNRFKSSYNRANPYVYERIISRRMKNLNQNNIKFLEIDSKDLINNFPSENFDLIWIDGDHLDPQVSIDIHNSIKLLKKGCIMCCDDIVKNNYKDEYISNESFMTLQKLEKEKKISNFYFLKRARYTNKILKKFISFSVKL